MNQLLKELGERQPVWKGPRKDGITQSLLSPYIVCPERSRLQLIDGLRVPEAFSAPIHFGEMFHLCEENHLLGKDWSVALDKYIKQLGREFPHSKDDIWKWGRVCAVLYPVYVDYWKEQTRDYIGVMSEYPFKIPIKLPSGRWFFIRGKMDGVIVKDGKLWLMENKTKTEIDRVKIVKRLKFDVQTMLYLVALSSLQKTHPKLVKYRDLEIAGVYYNVIRRPLSGGKGSIRRHKKTKTKPEETWTAFFKRLREEHLIPDANTYFDRFTAELDNSDIPEFRRQFLHPVLDNLYDDYVWWALCYRRNWDPYDGALRSKLFAHTKRHFRFPYGVYSPLIEGRGTGSDLDYFIDTGNNVGLEQTKNLFPEL